MNSGHVWTFSDGSWSRQIDLPAFSALTYSELQPKGQPHPKAMIEAEGVESNPGPENERALEWLLQNDANVFAKAVDRIFAEYPQEKLNWRKALEQTPQMLSHLGCASIEEWERRVMPDVSAVEELYGALCLTYVHLFGLVKDGAPCFGLEFECRWEQEHGLGILFHGSTVLESGWASAAFDSVSAKALLEE